MTISVSDWADSARSRLRYGVVPKLVDSILLFGSMARGDEDESSDIDLLAFVDTRLAADLEATKSGLERLFNDRRTNLTLYARYTAEEMAKEGSLFMWHLRLESRVLFSGGTWLEDVLQYLEPYTSAHACRDLQMLTQVHSEAVESLRSGSPTVLFDAATVFTVLRNVGIAAAYIAGEPIFGRRAPIGWLAKQMGIAFPYSEADLDFLESYRLAYNDVRRTCLPARPDVLELALKASAVLDFALVAVCQ